MKTQRPKDWLKKIRTSLTSSEPQEQLVYKTEVDRKVPSWGQIAYFSHLLSPVEKGLYRLAIVLLVISLPFLLYRGYINATIEIPQNGGSYTEGVVGHPQYINPVLSGYSDVDTDLTQLLFSGIFRYDENQQLQPDIITNYTISEDKKTYTFFLRPEIKWHDGETLSADDVLFTISMIQDPLYQSPLQGNLKGVTATKVDESTFTLTLAEPFAPFLTTLTFGILPKHIWFDVTPQSIGLNEKNLQPVGSGPYMLAELKKDREGTIKSLQLEKNKAFYGTKPYINEVNIVFYADEATAEDALKSKKVQGLAFFPADSREAIQKKNGSLNIYGLRIPQYTAVFFNQKNSAPLQEGAVRQALSYATNRDAIISDVFAGQAEAIYAPILPGYVGYHPEVEKYLLNVDQSIQLLEAANWKYPEGKNENSEPFEPRTKDGKPLEITVSTVDLTEYQKTLQLLQQQWKRIGVKVNINIVSAEDVQSNLIKNRDYEALLFGQIIGTDPDPFPFWHSSQQTAPGLSLAIFRDKEIDTLLDEARKATNDDERKDKYVRFQNNLAKDAPAIFLYNPTYQYAVNKKIHGVQEKQYITQPADRFAALRTWYIQSRRGLK